jgi:signal transduction histidine kinase
MNTVLVIDDEAGPRESLRMVLKHQYEVLLADHVDEGVQLLKERQPDTVIMDIRMPGKSGIEGLGEIRAIDGEVSVVMLTGYGALETAQEAIRLGANDYLKKPFDIDEIQRVIANGVQRTQWMRRRRTAYDDLKNLNLRLREQALMQEQMAAVGQASAEFAHDLRNPLTIITGYCDLLLEHLNAAPQGAGQTNAESLEFVQLIEENVKRCRDLADTWQKAGRGGVTSEEVVDLEALWGEIVQSTRPLALLASEANEYTADVEPARVKVDRLQLLRALHNVVTNALQALPARAGRIAVRCAKEGREVRMEIEDNGCGIPRHLLSQVFEQHFTTKPAHLGTGLGLTIARRIIEGHRGRIDIESEPGRGTKVIIHLPQYEEG